MNSITKDHYSILPYYTHMTSLAIGEATDLLPNIKFPKEKRWNSHHQGNKEKARRIKQLRNKELKNG